MRVPARRCSCDADRRGLDGAGLEAARRRGRASACLQRAPGRAWSGRWTQAVPGGGPGRRCSPMPSVPISAQRRPQQAQRLCQPPGGGGLAVGAGDGHHRAAARSGRPRNRCAIGAGQVLQVGDAAIRASSKPKLATWWSSTRQALAPACSAAATKRRASFGIAGPGQEGIARADLAAVGAQPAGDARAQPLRRGVGMGQVQAVRHQKLSLRRTALLAMICGVTARSGGTPIRRSVCCTTWLNTGAATAPP